MTITPKGNLLVGQSGGCTTVMNASLVGVIHEALKHKLISGIYGTLHGVLGILNGELVDLQAENPSTIEGLRLTPAAALGSCRYRLQPADTAKVLQTLNDYSVRYFIYIGGNDSADTAHKIAQLAQQSGYDLRVIHVPKTIDNDLPLTDHCPGYGSAARFLAIATQEAGRDTEAMARSDPIKFIEVMGRNAGWLAGACALGKRTDEDAPHLIYFPERPLASNKLLTDLEMVYRRLGYAVVIVPETLRDEKGQPLGTVSETRLKDAFGHPYIVGVASRLCRLVTDELGLCARWDKPGTIQRMSMTCVSSIDLEEAYLTGQMAVRYALEGHTDRMVTLMREPGPAYCCTTALADLAEVANSERPLPDAYLNAEENFVTSAFVAYAQPLLGSPLPQYVRLRKFCLPRLTD
ncbi:MAG: 6-phosphofructokinase [Chloroflexi bacterium]|nr:6-phosphofructokinase [Chloroflexota bacterium]